MLGEGDEPRPAKLVQALFLAPEHHAPDPMPVGRPYRATVDWRDIDEPPGFHPALMPILDGFTEDLLGA